MTDQVESAEPTRPETWDGYIESLEPEVRELYEAHVAGLKSTVQATREERDLLKARIDALVTALDGKEPTVVAQQLRELQGELAQANRRGAFYEEAGKPEIGCRNPKLAFLVAESEKLYDKRGNPDWDAIRKVAPELFGPSIPPGNAGASAGSAPSPRANINDMIRRAAGRRV